MDRVLSFVVRIPENDLTDFALNVGSELGDTPNTAQFAAVLKEAIIAGLEEYLGDGEVTVEVKPMS